MRARPSCIAAACIALVLLAGCDSFSLIESFSTELTLDVASSTLQQGATTLLYPAGGTEPYTWMILKGDQFYTDTVNETGTITDNKYTAGDSIGTVTVRLRDSAGKTQEKVITIIPPAPGLSTPIPAGNQKLSFTWTFPNAERISKFKIFRSSGGSPFTEIVNLPNSATGFTDENPLLSTATTYTYYIIAIAGTYESLPSAQKSEKTNN